MNIEDIKFIANHFGQTNQRCKLIEESGELSREISKDIAADRSTSYHTLEEMADCLILIEQLLYLKQKESNCDVAKLLGEIVDKKIERTLERIEEGYYENN